MARQVNLVCNFFFGFMHTNLPVDTVDIELTLRTVQEIYIYRKDHTDTASYPEDMIMLKRYNNDYSLYVI